ncbi:PKD domain-containing protein [Reichenbachiella sp. MALMAid0571]|uniref:PKD domain-containing protein n=1 Tax=Reichenbachiella sp. MALMAid0571 TaxID=3143939 RepID=UPI0032DE7B11
MSELDFEALIDNLSYENNSDDPSTTSRVVTITSISDDGGSGGSDDDTNDALSLVSTVGITPTNDAPVLSNTATFNAIDEDETNSTGTLISGLISSFGSDYNEIDSGDPKGFAVIGVLETNGSWEYTVDGSIWNSLTGVSATSAVLLASDGNNAIRFVPGSDYNGSTGNTVSLRAWDQTSGSDEDTGVDVTSSGGTTAYSSGTGTASITVNPINDEPSFTVAGNPTANTSSEGLVTIASFVTGVDLGPDDEDIASGAATEQAVSSYNLVTNSSASLFSVAPAISTSGTLTYTLATNAEGSSTIGFQLQDDGGTANAGDDDLSPEIQFTITVTDDEAPGVNAKDPLALGPDSETQIKFFVNLNENATIYYLVREVSTTPSKADILSGTAVASDIAGSFSYTTPTVQDEEVISTLTQHTTYYVHWYAVDESAANNETAIQNEGSIATTEDVIAPQFDGSTGITGITATSLDIDVDLDAAGTAFYVVLLDGTTAPSVTQVINGTDGSGNPPVAKGSLVVGDPGSPESETVDFLQSSTTYDIYLVAQDGNGNKSAVRLEADKTTNAAAVQFGGNVRVTRPADLILCLGEDYAPLGEIKLQEAASNGGGFPNTSLKTLVLTLPAELEFNTSASISISDDGGNDDFNPEINTTVPVLTTRSISLSYDTDNTNDQDEIKINGLQVKAVQAFSGTKSLLRIASNGGTATIDGIVAGDGTSFANFSVASASAPPVGLTVTYCTGDVVNLADFTTNDADFVWYTDFNLTNTQYSGEVTDPEAQLGFDVNVSGTTTLYVTNTGSGECESQAVQVNIVINPSPVADAGFDKVVCAGEELFIGGFPSLVSTGAVGTHTYQWRSEPLSVGGEVMRALDENFDTGTIPPTGWSQTGVSASGSGLAFEGADALRLPASGGNIVSPDFELFDSKAVLFFYGRAETSASNGAQIQIFGSDDGFGSEISLGTVFTSSTKYKQYAVEIPADDNGGGTFNIRIEYDNSGGADENFIIDELILDKGITKATEAVKSNPFFTPPSNNAGLGDLVYDVVLTIVDPNFCKSTDPAVADDYTTEITSHDKISPTIFLQDGGGNTVVGNVGINTEFLNIIIDPPATTSPGNPDSGVQFTGTAISYNSTTEFYEFSPKNAGGGDYTITYTYTESDTGDNCEESTQTSISVVASLLDGLILSNCVNVDPYNINPSQDLVDQLSGSGDSFIELRYSDNVTPLTFTNTYADPGSNTLPIYTFDPDQASSINIATNGKKYGPMSLFVVTSNTSTTITQSVDVVPQPSVGIQVYDDISDTFSPFQSNYCETDEIVQLSGILRSTGDVSTSTVQLTNLQDDGLYEISSDGGSNYITLTDGEFDPSIGAGSYIIRYTNDTDDDPAVEGGAGCTNSVLRAVTIIAQPSIPLLNTNPSYASAQDPDLSSSVTFGPGIVDNNGNDAYKFVYCEGDAVSLIYADFTDADNNKIQDSGTEKYFRWYDDDGSGNPDFGTEISVNAQSGNNSDRRIITQSDLFFGTPDPGTYSFHLTQTINRSPLTTGTTFAGCESTSRQIIFEVIAEPVVQDLDVVSDYYDDVANTRLVREYCEDEIVEDITIDDTGLGGNEIVWYDENNNEILVTTSTTVSPVQLGLGTNTPGSGTATPPVKSVPSTTATIEYSTSDLVPSFIVGELAVSHSVAYMTYSLTGIPFIVGEVITSEAGGQGTVTVATSSYVAIDMVTGFFPVGKVITGNLGGSGKIDGFSWWTNNGYGTITNVNESSIEININYNDFTVGHNITGSSTSAQAYIESITIDEIIQPYTFYYARRDASGTVSADAGEGDFIGCDGPKTKVQIMVYPKPDAPAPDTFFDDEIYACVGDIVGGTVLKSPIGGKVENIYYWYEAASGGTSFANTYDPASTDINKNADINYSEIPGINLSVAGTTTLYLSQADYAGKSGTGESIDPAFIGCESDDRTPVTITLFAKPDAPEITVTDDGGNPLSIADSPLPNSDYTYLVCRNEINDAYNFVTSTDYAGAHGVMFNWYTANPTTGALATFIGSFAPGSNPDPSTNLGLVGATGAKYFGITQTTDIVSGGEFGGCTGDPLIIAINVTGISTTPSVVNSEFYLCFGDEVQAGDLTATGESGAEFYWYSNIADIGNPSLRVATTNDPTGAALGLSSSTVAGNYTYYVTQATNFDRDATPSFEGCETPSGSHKQVTVHIEAIEDGPTLLTSELNRTICEGETFTAVSVTSGAANSYQWYRDDLGTDPIAAATGASYLPVVADFIGETQVADGKFTSSFSIYVGQFTGVSDCASNLTQVDLTVNPTPISPVTTADSNGNVYEICQNDALVNPAVDVGTLAAGEQYNWYSDAGLNNLVASGITFNISTLNVDPANAGSTNFWVAKTENIGLPAGFGGCEGPATMITYTVHPLPVLNLTDINSDPLPTKVCVDNGNISLTGNPASANGTFSISTVGSIGLTDNGDGTAVFNPLAAVGEVDPQDFLDQSELITITYTYTDGNTCVNSISKNITVNGLPELSVTFGREGQGTGRNEFCIDDAELNLIGNPSNASGTFSNAINNSAIDNSVGNSRAEIDLLDAFETINPAKDLRQVDYVVTFTYTNSDGCVNTTDVTIKINNTPEPAFTITRPSDALSSGTPGVDVEVCIDDLSTSSNLTLNERIVLLDNTDVSMGTLTTGVFSGDATGVPLSAAALSRNAEGEYYFYPAQAVQDAVSGNPVSFSNSQFVDFTIDYTFTNDLTCAGVASDFGNKKVIRVYRLPVPVVSVSDNGPNNNKEYCIDHGSLITLSTAITHNPGGIGTYREQNTGITLPVSVLNNATANGVSTSIDAERTATFDPEAAYTFAQDNGLLDVSTSQAIFNIVYDYTTDVTCNNVSTPVTLTVNPYPQPSFTYEQGGVEVDNEVCVDEGTLTLRSALGEGRSATFSAVGFTSDAITDKIGTATIDIEQLFKEAVAANLGAMDDRQISVDINLNYEDSKFCSADIVQTIVIHNLPVPKYDITQNGVSLVSGNLVEVCIDDMSVIDALDSEKIVLIDVTDQVVQGSRTAASFAGSNYNFSSNQLENIAEGKAYFYPREAVNFAELANSTLKGATSIDFVFDMSYQNEDGCTGKTLSSDASNGVLDFDNRLTIRVYRTPIPTIKVKEGSFDLDANAYCINDDVATNPIRLFVQSIGFDTGVGNGGTFVSDPPLSASALYGASVDGGLDEIFFNPATAYAEHPTANSDNGDAAIFKITYQYGTSDNGCQATSNEVTLTVNPLPFPTFTVEGVAYNQNEFCIDASNAEMTGFGYSDKNLNNLIKNSTSSFTNPANNNAGIIPKTPGISDFNFESAYNAAVSANLSDPRTHTITYTYTNNETGCTASVNKDVIINTKPIVSINSVGGCDRTPVDFEFTSIETAPGDQVQSALWDFDDLRSEDLIQGSNTSTDLNPLHLFSEPGEYFVTLTTTSLKGCTSLEVTEQVVVGDIPDVNFTVEGLCAEDEVVFVASPTSVDFGSVQSILFDFGDGTSEDIDTQGNADKFTLPHTYTNEGVYDVQLTLTTNNGCEQIHLRRVSILPNEEAPYFQDFEGGTPVKKDFLEWELVEATDERRLIDGSKDLDVIIESSGWSVDLRPIEDKDDDDWGKLPKDFNSWQFGIPSGLVIADDGVHGNVWVTNLDGNYNNGESRSWVYSPCFDISSLERPMVSFDQIYHFSDQRDGVVLQYSVDGGEEWIALGDYDVTTGSTGTEWFTHENISGKPGQQELQATNEGDIGWAGNKGADFAQWVSSRHKLDAIPEVDRNSVIFRFALGTDASAPSEGFAFDNFQIKERAKKVLLEQFSSTNVAASAIVDASINAIIDDPAINNNDIIRVNYHTSFKGELDDYDNSTVPPLLLNPDPISIVNIENPSARAVFYGISAAPTSLLGGAVNGSANARTDVPWTVNNLARRSLEDVLFDIDISDDFGADEEVLEVAVTATVLDDITDPANTDDVKELSLYIAIVENTVELTDAENGQLESRAALRKMLPNGIGNRFKQSFIEGTVLNVSKKWDIQKGVDAQDLSIVVFIQDVASKKVYQTQSISVAGKTSPTITGIDDAFGGKDYSLYPNPANKEVFVVFDRITTEVMDWLVYDQTGKVYRNGKLKPGASGFSLETDDFPSGMYFISINGENLKLRNKKLMITH